MFPDSRKPLLPAPGGCREDGSTPAGRRFWSERSTDEKEKHMTKDVNGMKKKRGRPALGRTRKLTRGVTVKFSPVSYEALRFRAGKSGRSLAVYIREAALAATVTARHTPEENALLRSLAGMANNLNQLARKANAEGYGKATLLCPLWANRIAPFGRDMIAPFGSNNINHLIVSTVSDFFV